MTIYSTFSFSIVIVGKEAKIKTIGEGIFHYFYVHFNSFFFRFLHFRLFLLYMFLLIFPLNLFAYIRITITPAIIITALQKVPIRGIILVLPGVYSEDLITVS